VIADALLDRLRTQELRVDTAPDAVVRINRHAAIEREQPALVRRLERDVVVDHARCAAGRARRIGYAPRRGALPRRPR